LDSFGVPSWHAHGRQGRNHADKGLHLHWIPGAGSIGEQVIEEPVVRVIAAGGFQRVHHQDQLLQELDNHVVIDRIPLGKQDRQREHRAGVIAHPRRAVCLIKFHARGKVGTVDGTDVVQPQETATKKVVAVGIFAVEPPGEVEQKFLEDALEKVEVGGSVNDEHPKRGQGVNRRVDIVEAPLVRRKRAIRMQKPFPQQDQ
jgi:hypothetical protein